MKNVKNYFRGGGTHRELVSFKNCSKLHVGLGFTLAEVLVTLGIIGVVSAMTLPTLTKNHQRQVYVTQLHKAVNELSQAGASAINDNNAVSLYETPYVSGDDAAHNFLYKYFKVIDECTSRRTPCFAPEYKRVNGSVFNGWNQTPSTETPCVSIASGASMCMAIHGRGYAYMNAFAHFYIDVNGSQGPNILGRDLFFAVLAPDGTVTDADYIKNESIVNLHKECVGDGDGSYGFGCLQTIMQESWKMDY